MKMKGAPSTIRMDVKRLLAGRARGLNRSPMMSETGF